MYINYNLTEQCTAGETSDGKWRKTNTKPNITEETNSKYVIQHTQLRQLARNN